MATKNEAGLYEVSIDDQTYEFQKWGAEESLKTLIKITKIIGKPFGLFAGAMFSGKDKEGAKEKLENMGADTIGMIMESLTQNLDEDVTFNLVKKVSSEGVLCNGAKISFNKHYEDKLDHLFKVVAAGLEVQYGNFFAAALDQVGVKKVATIRDRQI